MDSPITIEAAGGEHKLQGEVVGYVDLQRRREERSHRHEGAHDPYLFLTLGLGLATPASWLSLLMFVSGSPLLLVAAPLIPSVVLLMLGVWQLRRKGSSEANPGPGAEKQLLVPIRASGDAITPVEAAIETSLSVDEAEEILSRLAERGHLLIESRDGVLSYALPARD
jgi:hypothetical protein